MTAPTYLNINIPFEGFYGSKYSGEIDHQEEQFCEWEATENEREGGEMSYPEALRLTASELCELLYRHTDYGAAHQAVAALYADAFSDEASERLGFPLRLKFEALTSPREYNFETDRIFADIPVSAARALFAMSKAEGHEELGAVIRERFTSRSGFASHYSADLDEWLAQPLREWDHNELGTLLRACLDIAEARDPHGEEIGWTIYSRLADDCGQLDSARENAVDWPAFEAAREELRADKAEELREDDPDAPDPLDWRAGVAFRHPDQAPLI
jgi:hypothetical protein